MATSSLLLLAKCKQFVQSKRLTSNLTSIRVGRSPQWMSAAKAVECIQNDDHVYIQMAAATPTHVLQALTAHCRTKQLRNVHVHQLLTLGDDLSLCEAEQEGAIRGNSYFTSAINRANITRGLHDYTPINLSDLDQLFKNKVIEPKASILQLSPADRHGFHSFGATVLASKESLLAAQVRIGQVNEHCPRTLGDSFIHESQLDILVKHDQPLPELNPSLPNESEIKIGRLIAEHLVSDGATIQIGIGSIPEAVLQFLTNHRHLGLHSEMISDGVVHLIKNGIIDNSRKTVCPDRSITTFALGTRKLYDFIDDNPSIEFHPCVFTNDVAMIRRNPKPVAINSCLEIDLSGQSASDTIGPSIYSGFGGQLDFLRGASTADDGQGKAILAFLSQTKKGQSKIVPRLHPQAKVVSTRSHVNFVVTENGIASLFGKNLRQRAHELIRIAHPNHQEWLEKEAFQQLGCMPSSN